MTFLRGCDVSNYQTQKNFPGYDFVIIKASEGVGYKDPVLDEHYNNLLPGQKYGFYHFARPDLGNTAEAEADWFLSLVGQHAGKCVFCLDWEAKALDYPAEWALNWCKRVYEKTGVKPLFYCSQAFISGGKYKSIADYNCGLWMAQYAASPALPADSGWQNISIWQSGDSPLDQDTFYGDSATWDKYCAKEGETQKPAEEAPKEEPSGTVYELTNPNALNSYYFTGYYGVAKDLVKIGWHYVGVAWTAPTKGTDVICLYHGNDHVYTINEGEVTALNEAGWQDNGAAFKSGGSVPVYRLYNQKSGTHCWNAHADETADLIRNGWDFEGVGFYAEKA